MPQLQQYESQLTNGVGTISGTIVLRGFNSNRRSIMIQNLGTATLYVGGSGVTVDNGIQIGVNENIILENSGGAAVYCTADGTCNIRFIEEIV